MRVFISYSSKDIEYAQTVKALLDSLQLHVFLAETSLSPGRRLEEVIKEIRASDALLVVWSHHAKSSEWVREEIGAALGTEKLVLPVMLDETTAPPAFLRGMRYVNAYENPMASLPVIQQTIVEWHRWVNNRRKQEEQKRQADGFWRLVMGGLALVGGVTVLDNLGKPDSRR